VKKLGAILIGLAASLAVAAPADASWGGYGTVTTFGVGPLSFDYSGPSDVTAFAGKPDKVTYSDQYGVPTGAGNAEWALTEYHFPSHGYTAYDFWWDGSEWRLEEFDTTLQRFHTVRGTRVGMNYAEAKRREGRPWSGRCYSGISHEHKRDGSYYSLVVGVERGKRVYALYGFGPHPPLC
jgi:hypothetical protein